MMSTQHKVYKQKAISFNMGTTYVCNNCNYKFNSSKPVPPKRCPYCSAASSVEAEATASDLLREVEDLVKKEKI